MKFYVKKSLMWAGRAVPDSDGYETKAEPVHDPSDMPAKPSKKSKPKTKSEVAARSKRKPFKVSGNTGRVTPKKNPQVIPDTGFGKIIVKAQKMFGYTGPMSVADIELASWNEFFREGGQLNQPAWLQTNQLSKIRRNYARLARLHSPLAKAFKK